MLLPLCFATQNIGGRGGENIGGEEIRACSSLPVLIADEIGGVPDSVMGHGKGGVLKYLR